MTTWYAFDNTTGESRRLGEAASSDTRVDIPAAVRASADAFVRVQIGATGAARSWEQPIDVHFRRAGGAWKLVGLVRMP